MSVVISFCDAARCVLGKFWLWSEILKLLPITTVIRWWGLIKYVSPPLSFFLAHFVTYCLGILEKTLTVVWNVEPLLKMQKLLPTDRNQASQKKSSAKEVVTSAEKPSCISNLQSYLNTNLSINSIHCNHRNLGSKSKQSWLCCRYRCLLWCVPQSMNMMIASERFCSFGFGVRHIDLTATFLFFKISC